MIAIETSSSMSENARDAVAMRPRNGERPESLQAGGDICPTGMAVPPDGGVHADLLSGGRAGQFETGLSPCGYALPSGSCGSEVHRDLSSDERNSIAIWAARRSTG